MKNYLSFLCLILLLSACQNKEEKSLASNNKVEEKCATDSGNEKKFEMYTMSGLSMLMEQMHAHNKKVRSKIVKGEPVGKMPDFFNKIYTAKFTTPSDNDAFFKEKADLYLKAQKIVYEDSKGTKENFNKVVDACIACHQNKCGGPIPRIKKLYIK